METLQRYSDRYAFPKFFITILILKYFVMLISVSLYDLFLQVQVGVALCLMAAPHLERATIQHVRCVFQQLSEWVLLDSITNISEHPLGWRWEMDRGYIPIYSWSPLAPVELETLISRNCIAGNCSRNNCSCFKNNVKCISWQAITLTLNSSSLSITFLYV